MNFKVPEHKIDSLVWFLNAQGILLYGKIVMFTLAVTKEKTVVWYGLELENKEYHSVVEADILDSTFPKPMYKIGEDVLYNYFLSKEERILTSGVIASVEVKMYDDGYYEVVYTMQDSQDEEDFVLEDDIVSHKTEMKVCAV